MPYSPSGQSKLYYELHGEGPAVVLAHGVGGNHASWFNQVPSFAQSYTTITFDHRAFGNSDDIEESGQAGYLDDLLRLLDMLKLDAVSLVGQSMGGATCAAFACRHPNRVRALVHADSLAGVILQEPHASTLASTNARTRDLSQLERVLGPDICRREPEQAFLYLQIASFNGVTVKTVRGRAPSTGPLQELAQTGLPVLFAWSVSRTSSARPALDHGHARRGAELAAAGDSGCRTFGVLRSPRNLQPTRPERLSEVHT